MNTYTGISEANPRGDWMQTFTGRAYYPGEPRIEEIHIEDIAHALSMQCRYGGHCNNHYSVAEHSVLVSQMVPPEDALPALLHDATEAYVIDLPRPVKALLPEYRALEEKNWYAIAKRFGISPVLPDSVRKADIQILHSERAGNMKAPPLDWGVPDDGSRVNIHCWSPKFAEHEFLKRFHELTK